MLTSQESCGLRPSNLFSHRYDDFSGGFVERELQLSLHQHQNKKGVDLQIVSKQACAQAFNLIGDGLLSHVRLLFSKKLVLIWYEVWA